jgi:hypothetical protein
MRGPRAPVRVVNLESLLSNRRTERPACASASVMCCIRRSPERLLTADGSRRGSRATPAERTTVTATNDELVLCNRIAIYDRFGIWRYMPLQGALYGDLWLSRHGVVGFTGVGWFGDSWAVPLAEVTDVAPVRRSIYVTCPASMSFEAFFGGKRRAVCFTGVHKFQGKADRWLNRIPHGAGPLIVSSKSAYENRGAGERAKEAVAVWRSVLAGQTRPAELPRLN